MAFTHVVPSQESELTPTGSNLLDGRFAVFGYVVDNQNLLGDLQARADHFEFVIVLFCSIYTLLEVPTSTNQQNCVVLKTCQVLPGPETMSFVSNLSFVCMRWQ